MKTSDKGINLIIEFESLHDGDLTKIGLQPKLDPIGIWTEGYGRAMRNDNGTFLKGASNKELAYKRATIKTEKDARSALLEDLESRERIVIQNIRVPLNQNQFDALVSYVYNTGGSSTLYRYINMGQKPEVIRNWFETKYITAGGVKLKGLVRRRKAEADLYFSKL